MHWIFFFLWLNGVSAYVVPLTTTTTTGPAWTQHTTITLSNGRYIGCFDISGAGCGLNHNTYPATNLQTCENAACGTQSLCPFYWDGTTCNGVLCNIYSPTSSTLDCVLSDHASPYGYYFISTTCLNAAISYIYTHRNLELIF